MTVQNDKDKGETREAAMSRLKYQTKMIRGSNKRIQDVKLIRSNIELQHSQCTMQGQRPPLNRIVGVTTNPGEEINVVRITVVSAKKNSKN